MTGPHPNSPRSIRAKIAAARAEATPPPAPAPAPKPIPMPSVDTVTRAKGKGNAKGEPKPDGRRDLFRLPDGAVFSATYSAATQMWNVMLGAEVNGQARLFEVTETGIHYAMRKLGKEWQKAAKKANAQGEPT